jgi:hypothetical protein
MLDQKQLHILWKENPCWMFTGEEICEICNVSQNVVSRVKSMSDSPFFLNKCRPEWFLDWMRKHPEFQLTKAYTCEADTRATPPVASSSRSPAAASPTRKSKGIRLGKARTT